MAGASVIEKDRLRDLFDTLVASGRQLIGPVLEGGAIVYGPIREAADLPTGYVDEQDGGHYRLLRDTEPAPLDQALFRYTVGPHSWKRWLFPPRQRLWHASADASGFTIEPDAAEVPAYALVGVRPCELAALDIQDRVFCDETHGDPGYVQRRQAAFVVAVNCARPSGTCFCSSMGTGPAAEAGFDLCLSELLDDNGHRFLVASGSARGDEILAAIPGRAPTQTDWQAAHTLTEQAIGSMGRRMPAGSGEILRQNPEHPRWLEVAQRCLGCGNCTLVCPSCFCSTIEDTGSLDGTTAERWRRWDSCFSVEFSYLHGGPIRRDTAACYRQWLTHKLAYWEEQFGSSGCTGCGRCITWCPVGIDITAEVAAIESSQALNPEGGNPRGND